MAGAGETLVDAGAVHVFQPGRPGDGLGRVSRDDAEFGLRLSQSDLDIQPGLPAVFQAIKRADAGIRHPRGGGQCVAHGVMAPGGFLRRKIAAPRRWGASQALP